MVANGTSVDPSQHDSNQHCAIASNAAALPQLLVEEGVHGALARSVRTRSRAAFSVDRSGAPPSYL